MTAADESIHLAAEEIRRHRAWREAEEARATTQKGGSMTEFSITFFGADYEQGDPEWDERDVDGEMVNPAPCILERVVVADSLRDAILTAADPLSYPSGAVSVSIMFR